VIPRRTPHRPGSPRRSDPEAEIQIKIVALLRWHQVSFCHVPNSDGRAGARNQARLSRLGVETGMPDLLIFDPTSPQGSHRVRHHSAALELKSDSGRATPEQTARLADLSSRGWATAVVKGYAAAVAQLQAWGYLP